MKGCLRFLWNLFLVSLVLAVLVTFVTSIKIPQWNEYGQLAHFQIGDTEGHGLIAGSYQNTLGMDKDGVFQITLGIWDYRVSLTRTSFDVFSNGQLILPKNTFKVEFWKWSDVFK